MVSRILVVDDDPATRTRLVNLLEAADFSVEVAASPDTARQVIEDEPVDCVILDTAIADGAGFDFLKSARRHWSSTELPILVLSSNARVGDRIRALQSGASEFVGKPYDTEYLLGRVSQLLQTGDRSEAGTSLLLIDDDAVYLEHARRLLEKAGYSVNTATSGEEGLERASGLRPDLLVVDGRMPGMSGVDTIRRLREEPTLRFTPCLMLTASDSAVDEAEALNAGADDFVRKETPNSVLLARLQALQRVPARLGDRPDPEGDPARPKRILLVDDSEDIRQAVAPIIREEGCDVIEAPTGEAALALLEVQPVDGVLLDVDLPLSGMSGLETCRRIRRDPAGRDAAILMFHDGEHKETIVDALNVGADDYVAREAGPDLLKGRFRAVFRRKYLEIQSRQVLEARRRQEVEAARRKAAEQLADTLERRVEERTWEGHLLEALLERMKEPLAAASPDGRILRVNQAFADLVGYSVEDLGGMNLAGLTTDEDDTDLITGMLASDGPVEVEADWVRGNGEPLPVRLEAEVRRENTPDGKPELLLLTARGLRLAGE